MRPSGSISVLFITVLAIVPGVVYWVMAMIGAQKVAWPLAGGLFIGTWIAGWIVFSLLPKQHTDEHVPTLPPSEEEVEEMKKNEDYRREFVGNVSHELKTPLFNIQGYLDTLAEGGLDDPEVNMKYLKKAQKSTDRLINIVEDLDAITGFESDQLSLYLQKINLTETVREVLESLEHKAAEFNISLKMDQQNLLWVLADKKRIRQVLTNLVDNSIKYGKDNGTTELLFTEQGDRLLIEVKDDGIGMEEKHLPRLFERFYRVDESRSRDRGGTGLGLSIVKHIIDAHEQTIDVRSTEAAGTTFSFTLKKA